MPKKSKLKKVVFMVPVIAVLNMFAQDVNSNTVELLITSHQKQKAAIEELIKSDNEIREQNQRLQGRVMELNRIVDEKEKKMQDLESKVYGTIEYVKPVRKQIAQIQKDVSGLMDMVSKLDINKPKEYSGTHVQPQNKQHDDPMAIYEMETKKLDARAPKSDANIYSHSGAPIRQYIIQKQVNVRNMPMLKGSSVIRVANPGEIFGVMSIARDHGSGIEFVQTDVGYIAANFGYFK